MLSERRQLFLFVSLVLVAMIGMNGICLVNDVFSLYVFLEVTSVASFVLIAMQQGQLRRWRGRSSTSSSRPWPAC